LTWVHIYLLIYEIIVTGNQLTVDWVADDALVLLTCQCLLKKIVFWSPNLTRDAQVHQSRSVASQQPRSEPCRL